jgi:signal peptidase II
MNKFLSFISKPIVVILIVLIADQWLKIWVKTHMIIQQSFPLFGDWFFIDFIENRGMAFGMEFGGDWGKLALSLFRIVAITGIGYYLFKLPKETSKGLKISISLIFAGAFGNIIDSAFYGIIFDNSFNKIATFMPLEGGYASFLHGWVVDMFHFNAYWPQWVPKIGGSEVFPPIFNLADMSISIGIGLIFIFQKSFFKKEETPKTEVPVSDINE